MLLEQRFIAIFCCVTWSRKRSDENTLLKSPVSSISVEAQDQSVSRDPDGEVKSLMPVRIVDEVCRLCLFDVASYIKSRWNAAGVETGSFVSCSSVVVDTTDVPRRTGYGSCPLLWHFVFCLGGLPILIRKLAVQTMSSRLHLVHAAACVSFKHLIL